MPNIRNRVKSVQILNEVKLAENFINSRVHIMTDLDKNH